MENKPTTNQAKSAIEATSGHTGKLTWSINGGTLTIKGKGRMPNYDSNYDPDPADEVYGLATDSDYDDDPNPVYVVFNPDFNPMPWHLHRKDIYEVIIEEGVTKIGEAAFADCSNLISITIPDSVTKIESNAFLGCTGLGVIPIPKNVSNILLSAFDDCIGLHFIDVDKNNSTYASKD